jgi:hypothetical protein
MRMSISLALAGLVLAGSACLPEEEPTAAPDPIDAALVEEQSTATEASVDPEHVSSCVAQAQFGAFAGDPTWTQFWNDSGQTEAGAGDACRWLGAADPVQLQSIHEEWGRVEAFLEASAEAPAPEPPAPVPAGPQTFGTCAEAIAADGGNYRQGIDPEYGAYDDRDGDGVVCES